MTEDTLFLEDLKARFDRKKTTMVQYAKEDNEPIPTDMDIWEEMLTTYKQNSVEAFNDGMDEHVEWYGIATRLILNEQIKLIEAK